MLWSPLRCSAIIALVRDLQTPAGWDAAYQRVQQLLLDHKPADAIVVLEGVPHVLARLRPDQAVVKTLLAEAERLRAQVEAMRGK